MNRIDEFRTFRAKMNKKILDSDNLFFKRFRSEEHTSELQSH